MDSLVEAVSAHPAASQLLPLLAEAVKAEAAGKTRDASRYVTSAGARLVQTGGDGLKLAQRALQLAVFLARQPEPKGSDAAAFAGCNGHLADAYTWLASVEGRLGRTPDAEGYHKAAAKAVEDSGLVDTSLRTQHLLHFYRAAGEAAKHKALLRGWGAACEAAGRGAPPGWPPPPPPPPPPEKEGVPVTVPDAASSSSTAVVLSLSSASSKPGSAVTALPLVGTECLLDVLCASAATLHERCLWYAQRKKHPKAAALAAGPLLGLAVRVECFALRPRPGGPGQPPALCPLPVAVADMAAQLFASCGSVGAAACAQRARLGLLVIAVGWRDTPPLPRAADWEHARPLGGGASQTDDDDDDDGEEEGAPASACRDLPPTPAQLGLTDSWKEAVKAARAVDAACPLGSPSNVVLGSAWAPPVVAARVAAAAERAISFGDGWKCVYEPPPPLPPGSEPPPRPPSADEAAAVGVGLLSVANALMAAGKAHTLAAGRAARSAARLFGPLHGAQPAQAADAAHMAGAGLYHAGKVAQAGDAFAASAAAKEALGAAAPTAEAGVAAQYVETLLFLSKTLSEQQGKGEAASNVAGKALQAARTRLGDSHGVTKKALQACMEVKRAVAMRGGS